MRILTVRQPWAWAIIHGGKDVENRVRNIAGDYRGPVALQAGAARFEDDGQFHEVRRAIRTEELGWPADDGEVWATDAVDPEDPRFVYGAILGVVDLVDVHSPATDLTRDDFCQSPMGDLCSAWAEIESWHLMLRKPRALAEPIPYRGALGLRRLDDDTTARILAQIEQPTCPECRDGKHRNCTGWALDANDEMIPCHCDHGGQA